VRLLLALAVTAMLAPAAHAEPPTDRPLTGARYAASLAAAVEFWHAAPDCTVRFYAATDAELTQWIGAGTAGGVRGVQQGDECPVWVGPEYDTASVVNRVMVCTIVTHETGHLLGYEHSSDPASVMWPALARATWPCAQRFVPRGMGAWWRETYGAEWATRPS